MKNLHKIETLHLKKLLNTRDLGGLPAEGGKTIRYEALIRSGKLYNLPQKTIDRLVKIGVTKVIDLRIDTEVGEYPDTPIPGSEYIHLPVLCTATVGITHEKNMMLTMMKESERVKKEFGSVDKYMVAMYRSIFMQEEPQSRLAKFLRILVEEPGCVLWHCSAGKDRAGICAMLIESLLGVEEQLIVLDYTLSDRFQRRKRIWQKLGMMIVPMPKFRALLFGMMNAKRRYMLSVMEMLKEEFGSIVEYCKQKLSITDQDIAILREKYLEKA
ncbi:MAG: tyrosine-protein phosphatase [Clostridia bacterium]|nr:tyrosine-protein phosphatase [Clostridia bacterium]